jgi:ABC-2 type transport system permease protein
VNKEQINTNLRIVWAIAAKDIVGAIKDTTTISVILGVTLMMLSSQALPLLLKLSPTPIAVFYDAGDSALLQELGKNRQLRLHQVSSRQAMEKLLGESSGATLGLLIPGDFDSSLETGQPIVLDGYFTHWVSRSDVAATRAFFEKELTALAAAEVRINLDGHAIYPQPDSDGQPFMVSLSLTIVIMTVCVFLVPHLMLEEKETRTLDALLVSPASISQVVSGKAIAGLVYGLTASGVVFAFNQALIVHWGLALLAALCGTLFAVALGLLLGSLFDNPQNLNLWTGLVFIILLMPTFLIMTSASSLPGFLQTIIPWVPSAALAQIFRVSFAGNIAWDIVLPNLASVLGGAALLLALVMWLVRRSDR